MMVPDPVSFTQIKEQSLEITYLFHHFRIQEVDEEGVAF